jgi:hypothetical protein
MGRTNSEEGMGEDVKLMRRRGDWDVDGEDEAEVGQRKGRWGGRNGKGEIEGGNADWLRIRRTR